MKKKTDKLKKFITGLSRMQLIALGFLIIILAGTLLLMLPIASREGTWTNPVNAFFTATSATCVTGLVAYDTYLHWTLFGQIVIILLIQIGGLGFMSIAVVFSLAIHRKIGLRERGLLSESVNAIQLGGVVRMAKHIVFGTLCVEGIGAVLLSIRFVQELGILRGIYYGVFHSISAFCNAGFDLMGYQAPFNSLVNYSGDWIVNLTIMALIVIGGIGFLVWDDVFIHRWNFRKYHLHSKLALTTTAVLLFGGAFLFYCFEKNNLAAGMGAGEAFLTCMFDSVTPRTAGFNTTDVAGLTDASKLLTLFLMFIGGSPGSTAGGVKTTTIVLFLLYMRANFTRSNGVTVWKRKVNDEAIQKASAVVCMNFMLFFAVTLFICGTQGLNAMDVLLETVSAVSTVGLSTGITRQLSTASRLLVALLMYCGRVGSLSMFLSFAEHKKEEPFEYPEGKILIG